MTCPLNHVCILLCPSSAEELNSTMTLMGPICMHFLLSDIEANHPCPSVFKFALLVIRLELVVIIVTILAEVVNSSFRRLALQLEEVDIFAFVVLNNNICADSIRTPIVVLAFHIIGPQFLAHVECKVSLCPIFSAPVHTVNRLYLLLIFPGPLIEQIQNCLAVRI